MRAFAINSIGVGYGSEVSFTTTTSNTPQDGQPCSGTPTLTDIDGNVYNTVQIGQQCWMKENLRTTKYADNTEIPAGNANSETSPLRYAPNNDETNVLVYGYLYNWPAVMHGASSSDANPSGVQGICPNGWHVPSVAEWTQLRDFVSSQSQYICGSNNSYIAKALAHTTGWSYATGSCEPGNTPTSNNATGFSALPAGGFFTDNFSHFHQVSYFWSTTKTSQQSQPSAFEIHYNNECVTGGGSFQNMAYSVRCIRDEDSSTEPHDGQPCPNNTTVIDIDGNVYNTVQIGNQCWMKENLRTTRYANSIDIPVSTTYESETPCRHAPNSDETNILIYGYLYNWHAVMHGASSSAANPSGVQGICPDGWHVPSDAEWTQLTDYVSNQDEYVCGSDNSYIAKALASTNDWHSFSDVYSGNCNIGHSLSSNNTTGFSAMPAGFSDYSSFGEETIFCCSTESSPNDAWYRKLEHIYAFVERGDAATKNWCFSVRCLKN